MSSNSAGSSASIRRTAKRCSPSSTRPPALGRPFGLEFRARRHDGEYRWLASSGAPAGEAAGGRTGYVGCCIDVTERRALEQRLMQAERAEAIVQLAGGIAHDFNNLLTGIFGHLALLEEQPDLSSEARDDIGQIQQSADRAASLARQLVAFSRRQLVAPRILDLNRLVGGTVSAIRRMVGSRIQVVPSLDPQIDPVMADPGQLEQVLLQLSAGARDAMPDGGTLEVIHPEGHAGRRRRGPLSGHAPRRLCGARAPRHRGPS